MNASWLKLLSGFVYMYLVSINFDIIGQPVCNITGGSEEICHGTSTYWSAPEGMLSYYWTGPSGFIAFTREINISTGGLYTLEINDLTGSATCSRNLTVGPELNPGSINTSPRQFCSGGTTVIGGTNPPYGPATGGSGLYYYTWQLQIGCTGTWTDIPGTNSTSYTPDPPSVNTCYRRKVQDQVCNTETWTDFKMFEIFEDPVSQIIVPLPGDIWVCSGSIVSATFTGGSGGFPGGTTDIYEYSMNSGVSWSAYAPEQALSTAGLSGPDIVMIRTRRISTGVNGCNYGSYVTVSWSVNPLPGTSPIYHR